MSSRDAREAGTNDGARAAAAEAAAPAEKNITGEATAAAKTEEPQPDATSTTIDVAAAVALAGAPVVALPSGLGELSAAIERHNQQLAAQQAQLEQQHVQIQQQHQAQAEYQRSVELLAQLRRCEPPIELLSLHFVDNPAPGTPAGGWCEILLPLHQITEQFFQHGLKVSESLVIRPDISSAVLHHAHPVTLTILCERTPPAWHTNGLMPSAPTGPVAVAPTPAALGTVPFVPSAAGSVQTMAVAPPHASAFISPVGAPLGQAPHTSPSPGLVTQVSQPVPSLPSGASAGPVSSASTGVTLAAPAASPTNSTPVPTPISAHSSTSASISPTEILPMTTAQTYTLGASVMAPSQTQPPLMQQIPPNAMLVQQQAPAQLQPQLPPHLLQSPHSMYYSTMMSSPMSQQHLMPTSEMQMQMQMQMQQQPPFAQPIYTQQQPQQHSGYAYGGSMYAMPNGYQVQSPSPMMTMGPNGLVPAGQPSGMMYAPQGSYVAYGAMPSGGMMQPGYHAAPYAMPHTRMQPTMQQPVSYPPRAPTSLMPPGTMMSALRPPLAPVPPTAVSSASFSSAPPRSLSPTSTASGRSGSRDALPSGVASASVASTATKSAKGTSCHQCKNTKSLKKLAFCSNSFNKRTKPEKRACRKKYCDACLRKFYNEPMPADPKTFVCASCQHRCVCAACVRHLTTKSKKQRSLSEHDAATVGDDVATTTTAANSSQMVDADGIEDADVSQTDESDEEAHHDEEDANVTADDAASTASMEASAAATAMQIIKVSPGQSCQTLVASATVTTTKGADASAEKPQMAPSALPRRPSAVTRRSFPGNQDTSSVLSPLNFRRQVAAAAAALLHSSTNSDGSASADTLTAADLSDSSSYTLSPLPSPNLQLRTLSLSSASGSSTPVSSTLPTSSTEDPGTTPGSSPFIRSRVLGAFAKAPSPSLSRRVLDTAHRAHPYSPLASVRTLPLPTGRSSLNADEIPPNGTLSSAESSPLVTAMSSAASRSVQLQTRSLIPRSLPTTTSAGSQDESFNLSLLAASANQQSALVGLATASLASTGLSSRKSATFNSSLFAERTSAGPSAGVAPAPPAHPSSLDASARAKSHRVAAATDRPVSEIPADTASVAQSLSSMSDV